FAGNYNGYTITWDGTTATVSGAGEGTDTLDSIGRLQFADHSVFLVGQNSDYTSVQAAVDAATSGDIILLSAGTFTGAVDVVNKDITILGANHGHDSSTWASGSESVIDRVAASGSDLTLDGVAVVATTMGAGFVNGYTREAIGFVGDSSDDL